MHCHVRSQWWLWNSVCQDVLTVPRIILITFRLDFTHRQTKPASGHSHACGRPTMIFGDGCMLVNRHCFLVLTKAFSFLRCRQWVVFVTSCGQQQREPCSAVRCSKDVDGDEHTPRQHGNCSAFAMVQGPSAAG